MSINNEVDNAILIAQLIHQAQASTETEVIISDKMVDAFHRMRVSETITLLNYVQNDNSLDGITDTVVDGSGAYTWVANKSASELTTTTSGDYVIRQTINRFEYQAGRGNLIYMTMANFQPEDNIIKRIGYFSQVSGFNAPYDDNYDGIVLESSNNELRFKVFNSGESTLNIAQSEWNTDKLDGSGPSGFTLKPENNTLFWTDFQWLGSGIVRLGFVVDGHPVTCHLDGNINQSLSKVYMRSPVQPCRWEIRQTGPGSGRYDQICASVIQEGATAARRQTRGG
jgi:hypothetical protein